MRVEREDSKIMVELLDFSLSEAAALAYYNETKGDADRMKVNNTHGVVVTSEGVWVLCSEGVGPEHLITQDDPYIVEFFSEKDTKDGYSFSIVPVLQQKMSDEFLLSCRSGEKVALHDFIRKFGDRLERNYNLWRRTLENKNLVEVA